MERYIMVSVPGPWETLRELNQALTDAHGNKPVYRFDDPVMMETETRLYCEAHRIDPVPAMREAFQLTGQDRLSAEMLDAVEAHRSSLVLIFQEPGYETARTAARFAAALLRAGGCAVKVDTAAIAHSPEGWIQASASDEPSDLYSLFVQLMGGELLHTCGMQNFGLPDAAVQPADDVNTGAQLLDAFNLYQLVEAPALRDGETFCAAAGSPPYRITRGPCLAEYPPENTLHNPHGMWTLRPAEAPPAKQRNPWWPFGG